MEWKETELPDMDGCFVLAATHQTPGKINQEFAAVPGEGVDIDPDIAEYGGHPLLVCGGDPVEILACTDLGTWRKVAEIAKWDGKTASLTEAITRTEETRH